MPTVKKKSIYSYRCIGLFSPSSSTHSIFSSSLLTFSSENCCSSTTCCSFDVHLCGLPSFRHTHSRRANQDCTRLRRQPKRTWDCVGPLFAHTPQPYNYTDWAYNAAHQRLGAVFLQTYWHNTWEVKHSCGNTKLRPFSPPSKPSEVWVTKLAEGIEMASLQDESD